MRKLFFISCLAFITAIAAQESTPKNSKKKAPKTKTTKEIKDCGEYEGHKLYKGAKGGCYYKDRSSKTKKINKVYVDNKYCNC
jgi:hypothetical protein